MKTRVDVATARSFTSLLTSSALRDAIAMPSVWHRPSRPKMVVVNRFRSDYPLYLAYIACWSLDTLGRHHEVCVSIVDVKRVARFCVDPVRVFLQPPRVTNDRDRDLGYSATEIRSCGPPSFAEVARHSCVSRTFPRDCCARTVLRFQQFYATYVACSWSFLLAYPQSKARLYQVS